MTFFRSGFVDLCGTDLLESGSLNSAFKDALRYFQPLLQSSIYGILLAPRSRKSEIKRLRIQLLHEYMSYLPEKIFVLNF